MIAALFIIALMIVDSSTAAPTHNNNVDLTKLADLTTWKAIWSKDECKMSLSEYILCMHELNAYCTECMKEIRNMLSKEDN